MFLISEKIKEFYRRINELQETAKLNFDISVRYRKLKAEIELFGLQVKLHKIQNERNSK